MLSILAAALALVSADPTTNFTETKVETSEPVAAICTIKSPTNSLIQAQCAIVAMRDDTVSGVAFATEGGNIMFLGVAVEGGLNVGAVMVGETLYEAEGACAAEQGKVTCAVRPTNGGTATLAVQAVY